jgi:hypothetical protein
MKNKNFQDLFIEDLGEGLSFEELEKVNGGGKEPTTLALEEEGHATTMAVGEEGDDPTTMATHEEGDITI